MCSSVLSGWDPCCHQRDEKCDRLRASPQGHRSRTAQPVPLRLVRDRNPNLHPGNNLKKGPVHEPHMQTAPLADDARAVAHLCSHRKLTSIVVRLQEGIGAMLEGLREHIHCTDTDLLLALLTILSDVSHNAANVQVGHSLARARRGVRDGGRALAKLLHCHGHTSFMMLACPIPGAREREWHRRHPCIGVSTAEERPASVACSQCARRHLAQPCTHHHARARRRCPSSASGHLGALAARGGVVAQTASSIDSHHARSSTRTSNPSCTSCTLLQRVVWDASVASPTTLKHFAAAPTAGPPCGTHCASQHRGGRPVSAPVGWSGCLSHRARRSSGEPAVALNLVHRPRRPPRLHGSGNGSAQSGSASAH